MASTEVHPPVNLVTSRIPVGPVDASASTTTVGGMAFNDSVAIIVVCWLIVFALVFSLRRHNV